MISTADEDQVRSLLEQATRQTPPVPVPLERVAVRAGRIRTVRRAVRGSTLAGGLAVAGLVLKPLLGDGPAASGGAQPAAGGTAPTGTPWIPVLVVVAALALSAAVVVLIVLGTLGVGRRLTGGSRPVLGGPARWSAAGAAVVLVAALAAALTLRVVVLPSESMADTLQAGDRLLVTTVRPGVLPLRRGDVIVFRDPGGWLAPDDTGAGTGYLVKRVIGLPGDRVACCDAAHRITVNGVAVAEPYVRPGDLPLAEPFSVVVAPGRLWVLGDHRSASADSRYHRDVRDGQVPVSSAVGTVVTVVWPPPRFGVRAGPGEVFTPVR